MNDYKDEEAEPPFAMRMSPNEIFDAEDVSGMFKAYLDRLRKERNAISNNL